MNLVHNWLVGCPCHDHIWNSAHLRTAHQQQKAFEGETGLTACWRRGRRGSEFARGHKYELVMAVVTADSALLQARLARLPAERATELVHKLESMKRMWAEEVADKLEYWQNLPWLALGLWPIDDAAQHVAQQCVAQWDALVAANQVATCHRVTKLFMDSSAAGNPLPVLIRRLADTGVHDARLALAAKEYNLLATHSQRVEELHARLLSHDSRGARPCEPPRFGALMKLRENLTLVDSMWEARLFVRAVWRLHLNSRLLKFSEVGHALAKRASEESRSAKQNI